MLLGASLAACEALGLGDEPADLTPEGTVQGYLEASVAGECRTASQLATTDHVRQGLFCSNPRMLSYGSMEVGEGSADRVAYRLEAAVVAGTGLDRLGLEAGENNLIIVVLRKPDGTWRVNEINPRR